LPTSFKPHSPGTTYIVHPKIVLSRGMLEALAIGARLARGRHRCKQRRGSDAHPSVCIGEERRNHRPELAGRNAGQHIKGRATYGRASPPRKQAERSNQGASDAVSVAARTPRCEWRSRPAGPLIATGMRDARSKAAIAIAPIVHEPLSSWPGCIHPSL